MCFLMKCWDFHQKETFTIDLVPGSTPVSKNPYRMSTPKLVELKMKLHALMEKKYIIPSVSPCGAEEGWDFKVVY